MELSPFKTRDPKKDALASPPKGEEESRSRSPGSTQEMGSVQRHSVHLNKPSSVLPQRKQNVLGGKRKTGCLFCSHPLPSL